MRFIWLCLLVVSQSLDSNQFSGSLASVLADRLTGGEAGRRIGTVRGSSELDRHSFVGRSACLSIQYDIDFAPLRDETNSLLGLAEEIRIWSEDKLISHSHAAVVGQLPSRSSWRHEDGGSTRLKKDNVSHVRRHTH